MSEALPESRKHTPPTITTPDAKRLLSVYLRTLNSQTTAKTYNTEVRMFLKFLDTNLGPGSGRGLGEITIEDV